jgi:transposase
MPAAVKTVSKGRSEPGVAVAEQEPQPVGPLVEAYQQVPGLLRDPGAGRVRGDEALARPCTCRQIRPCWSVGVPPYGYDLGSLGLDVLFAVAVGSCAMMPSHAPVTGLGITRAFALLRLLSGSDRDKDAEILALRHQLAVLDRRLGGQRVRFEPADRAWLAALFGRLPRPTLQNLRLLVRPDTILRWHRDLLARRHAAASRPRRRGRPRTIRIRVLVLRLVRENPSWGYRRVHGELLTLGVNVAASTVWEILREAGIDPAPDRAATTWTQFLRSQAEALLAADFLETVTLTGTKMYVLAVIEHASRRVRILGATAHPSAAWVTQTARNLVMDLQDAGCQVKHPDPRPKRQIPDLFNAVLADADTNVVPTGVRMPRMNAAMERWVRTCRRDLLDRTLIFNQRHLLHALHEYEVF